MTFGEYYPSTPTRDPELSADYLRLAGFEEPIVELLADSEIDAPALTRLVANGCPLVTAIQILL